MYNYNIFALYMCGKILSTACDFLRSLLGELIKRYCVLLAFLNF